MKALILHPQEFCLWVICILTKLRQMDLKVIIRYIGRRLVISTNFVLIIGTLLSYIAAHISPEVLWPLGFVSWLIPFLIFANIIFAIFWFIVKPPYASASCLVLLLGLNHLTSTFKFSFKAGVLEKNIKNINILSYNVRVFNVYNHLRANPEEFLESKQMITWLQETDADIMCLQEFYCDIDSKVYNTLKKLKQKNKYHAYFLKTFSNRYGADFGMTIFSKYPIINKGRIKLEKASNNQMMFADLLVGKDTLRVYNIHLYSMAISNEEIDKAGISDETSKTNLKIIFKRLKQGFKERAGQVALLSQHIEDSPYPVIVCGDLNDLPYGYPYYTLNKNLKNAFVEKGHGTGVTYNGKVKLLRIDNQFYDPELQLKYFNTIDSVKYSDHYPLWAAYRFPEK
jgi:endonuclease/exonuclease/phosphatase family metal-dependent hydrolase